MSLPDHHELVRPRGAAFYGAPREVRFCTKCVMSNQRPCSCNEYAHTVASTHQYIEFDDEGVCSACRFNEAKNDGTMDWTAREEELLQLLDKFRSRDGSYDCLVPGSGGKDSAFASHILKERYGMHPLTVTWAPHLYTDIGWQNFENWIHRGGFDNFLFTPNGRLHRLLTRNSVLNLLHPFHPFVLGQKTFATKMAVRFGIQLIFYGENPGEYGARIGTNERKFSTRAAGTSKRDQGHQLAFDIASKSADEVFLAGLPMSRYLEQGIGRGELATYLPPDPRVLAESDIEFHYLGYYIKWVPQECYYYAVDHTGFQSDSQRTEGTYAKYNSIDDRVDGFHFYTTHVKFGFGRATEDASQEIRNRHLTREEGVALVRRFDGEFPRRYLSDFLAYIDLTEDEFLQVCDRFRSPHLWEKVGDEWRLKHTVWEG